MTQAKSPSADDSPSDDGVSPLPSDDFAEVWRALSNTWRRRILDLLRVGPMTTGALADEFPHLSRFAVMQHLKVLEEGNLVLRERSGRQTINRLNAVPIQQIHRRWVSRYEESWMDSLVSLKEKLEGETDV